MVLYFDRKISAEERRRYEPLIKTLPPLEHLSGNWGLGQTPCEIYVLQLRDGDLKAQQIAVKPKVEDGAK